jgi:nucleotide-binding universal stress UspA family protein
MKILLAVDGSEYTKRMLAYLAAHDELFGGAHDYTVLTVVPAISPRAASVLEKSVVTGFYADEADKTFKPIRTFFGKQGLQAKFVDKVGHAAEVIAKMADSGKFDLLVMGSHGHSALGSLVMGSITTKVLAACGTPVLLVR